MQPSVVGGLLQYVADRLSDEGWILHHGGARLFERLELGLGCAGAA